MPGVFVERCLACEADAVGTTAPPERLDRARRSHTFSMAGPLHPTSLSRRSVFLEESFEKTLISLRFFHKNESAYGWLQGSNGEAILS